MGQLFNRISTGWSDSQTSSILTQNNYDTIKPMISKRKCMEHDNFSKKRKISRHDDCLSVPIRISKSTRSYNFANRSIMNHSFSTMILFKCQLCCRCFSSKDSYFDHMVICAIERQASIKIVRAIRNKSF